MNYLIAVLVFVAGSCHGAGASGSDAGEVSEFWSILRVAGVEAERFLTFEEMADSADIVAMGRFAGFTDVRVITTDTEEDIVFLGVGTIEITDFIAGREPSDIESVTIEFLLPVFTLEDAEKLVFDQLAAFTPKQELLLFLRHKGPPGEVGLYRAVNSLGIWFDDVDAGLVAPLALDPDEAHEFSHTIADATSVSDIADALR